MSKEGLAMVLGKAVVDQDFLRRLKKDPRNATKEITPHLTRKELEFLKKDLDYVALGKFAEKLDIKYFDKSEISGQIVLTDPHTNKAIRLKPGDVDSCWIPKYH